MKVTRVILAANDNPLYYQFWNPISKVYKQNFGIEPTLILFGEAHDIKRLGLSDHYGNIIIQTPIPNHHIGWQTAWSLFWFMHLYPDDTFCTMGIDQVPLSPWLIKDIPSAVDDDHYLLLADDAYSPSHWMDDGGTSPTSYHIVKGSVANKVYGFEKTFKEEIEKVAGSGINAYYGEEQRWGLDESYSSHKLREFDFVNNIVVSKSMFKEICDHRIECCRTQETPYDPTRLQHGFYGDAHFCRPFAEHQQYIEKILNLIPKQKESHGLQPLQR